MVVPLAVGSGLRQGEASGLTADRVDFLRRTLRVDRSRKLAEPKTASGHRTVPLATVVANALAEHLAEHPAKPGQLVIRSPAGDPLDLNRFGYHWRLATEEAGMGGLRYHDLRHTFASLLLSRGVSVKAVAEWLGHASPVVTLNTYAHVMPTDEDLGRRVLDQVLVPDAEDQLRTTSPPTGL